MRLVNLIAFFTIRTNIDISYCDIIVIYFLIIGISKLYTIINTHTRLHSVYSSNAINKLT